MVDCPDEVIAAGRALTVARKTAWNLTQDIDAALAALYDATNVVTTKHGAKVMQAGTAHVKLRQAQAAYGLIMEAHDSLRAVLIECGIDQPTDAQILSIR
jgi:hypothetical protein